MRSFLFSIITFFSIISCQQSNKIGFVDNAKLINEYQEKN